MISIGDLVAMILIGIFSGAGSIVTFILASIAVVMSAILLLRWELFGKLICLADEPICAIIGMVWTIESPKPRENNGDDDTNINLLLGPDTSTNTTKEDLDKMSPDSFWEDVQGYLIKENPSVITHGYVKDNLHVKALHCEFEGEGYRTLLDAAYWVLGFLIAALALALAAVAFPLLGWFALLLAIAALLFGGVLFRQELSAPSAPIAQPVASLKSGDFVILQGKWVYDSLHEGWNEIHPVTYCQKIETFPEAKQLKDIDCYDDATGEHFYLDSDANIQRCLDIVCNCLKNADDAVNEGSHEKPENGWTIHPSIDGCKPPIIIE